MAPFILSLALGWLRLADASPINYERLELKREQAQFQQYYERHKHCGVYWPKVRQEK